MDIQIKKKLLWAVTLSVTLTAVLLLKIDLSQFPLIAARMDRNQMLIACSVFFIANIIRTYRFYKLDTANNKLGHWWLMNQIYNFMTSTLPGGAGEVATVYLLKRFSSLNILGALRLLILTRIMDLASLSALLFFAATQISKSAPYRNTALWISGVALILSVVIAHPKSERYIVGVLKKIPIKGRVKDFLCDKLEDVAQLSEKRGGAFFALMLAQSMGIMIGSALTVHFALLSFGTGFLLVQSLYCFGVYAFFQMVPVQGIAGIGTQAAWWSLGLALAGYKSPDMIALGIVLHITFYLLITAMCVPPILYWFTVRKSS